MSDTVSHQILVSLAGMFKVDPPRGSTPESYLYFLNNNTAANVALPFRLIDVRVAHLSIPALGAFAFDDAKTSKQLAELLSNFDDGSPVLLADKHLRLPGGLLLIVSCPRDRMSTYMAWIKAMRTPRVLANSLTRDRNRVAIAFPFSAFFK